jgi:NAD(P)-dependent dehydrogenase (short-subunit alcohol dehydrogenase family)
MLIPENFPPASVAGTRVVITGAGRGLGSVLATAFSRQGAFVVLVGRSKDDLVLLSQTLPNRHLIVVGDVRDEEFNDEVVQRTIEEFDGLDVWIANAGISPVRGPATEIRIQDWQSTFDTNVTGAFLGMRAAARVMKEGGRIIATSSVLGQRSVEGLCAYNASKSALDAIVRTLALELGPRKISVNAVAPGWFDSPLASGFRNDSELEREILGHTAMGRWGVGEDLPGIFLFLASPAAAFITGAVIPLDGGYLLS